MEEPAHTLGPEWLVPDALVICGQRLGHGNETGTAWFVVPSSSPAAVFAPPLIPN